MHNLTYILSKKIYVFKSYRIAYISKNLLNTKEVFTKHNVSQLPTIPVNFPLAPKLKK